MPIKTILKIVRKKLIQLAINGSPWWDMLDMSNLPPVCRLSNELLEEG